MTKIVLNEKIKDLDGLMNFAHKSITLVPLNSIFLLEGELGAGKTTFVSAFCEGLKINIVQSPTYAIHNHYENAQYKVDHFDLYRLTNEEEIESSGFYDLFYNSESFRFIEWASRLDPETFSGVENVFRLQISVLNDQSRELKLVKIN